MIPVLLLQSVALSGATVHPMTAAGEPYVATVLVEAGRIVAIVAEDAPGPRAQLGTRELDVTGRHLVPGLIDGYARHRPEDDPLYLAAGVTLVRDSGGDVGLRMATRERAARDRVGGPDLLVAGPLLDGPDPVRDDAAVLRDAEEAAAKLEPLFQLDVDHLSIHSGLPKEAWAAVLEAAAAHDTPVIGPLPSGVPLERAIEGGQDVLVGLDALLPEGRGWHDVRADELEPALAALAAARGAVAVTPLLRLRARAFEEPADEEAALALLDPWTALDWRAELDTWRRELGPELKEAGSRSLLVQRALCRRLYEAGVPLVPGSAAPGAWLLPGAALRAELVELAEAGIPPHEVLRLATAGAARALGVEDERGTLEVGKLADILVLASDPRDSVHALADPEAVLLRGRLFERGELEARLAAVREVHARALAELARPIEVAPPELPDGRPLVSGLARTESYGLPVSGERFAVVELGEGRRAWCTRLSIPETALRSGSELELVQVLCEGLVESFRLDVRGGERTFTVEGREVEGLLSVERSVDGRPVAKPTRARQPVALIDAGSVLGPMLAANELPAGASYVLGFDGLDPVVDRWQVAIEDDGRVAVTDSRGWILCGLGEHGAPRFVLRQDGNATTDVQVSEVEGPGLAPARERIWRGEAARPAEAAAGTEDGDG